MNTSIPKHNLLAIAGLYDEARKIIKDNGLTDIPDGYPVTPAIASAILLLAIEDAQDQAFAQQEARNYQKMAKLDTATWDLDVIEREIGYLGRQVWA